MEKIDFKDLPNLTTPLNAENLNKMQSNIEKSFYQYLGNNPNINDLHYENGNYGLYNCSQTPTSGGSGILEVLIYTRDWVLQRYTEIDTKTGDIRRWERSFWNATSWSDWIELVDTISGTFTPTIKGQTTAGTATYSFNTGNYVKIGKLIFYNFRINCTLSGSSGHLVITDLPFGNFGNLHGDLIGNLAIGSLGTSVFPSKPYCTRSLGVDGRTFAVDEGDVVAVEDKNWSNNHYFYGTGFVILQ